MVEEVFLTDEQREWSFETESTTVEGSVRLLKWQQKNVYILTYTYLIKQHQGLRGMTPIF